MSDFLLKGGRGRGLLGGFLLFLLALLLARWAVAFYVDLLWFSAEGARAVLLTRVAWEWGTKAVVGVTVGLLCWVNLRVVLKTFAGIQIRRRFGDLVIQEQLPESYVRWSLRALCVLLGLWFAAALPAGAGMRALLLLNAPAWELSDPIFGRDLGFYVFTLPVLEGILLFGIVVALFLAGLVAAGYSATGAIEWGSGRVRVRRIAQLHLGVLGAVFLLFLATRFHLAPFSLLQDGNSGVQGIFGFADHRARVPAYRILTFLALGSAGALLWGAVRDRMVLAGATVGGLAVVAIIALQVVPSVVQRFQVEPNELARETPYIQHAVEFTRRGFGLEDLSRRDLPYAPPDWEDWDVAGERLARIPIWTERTLFSTFRQIEARREYYDFHRVAFDRYPGPDGPEPVALAVREVDPNGIPDPNWQNRHLRERYISGMGAVAGRLNRVTEEGRLPMYLTGIPPEYRGGPDVPEGLELDRFSVYVGIRPQLHAVISPQAVAELSLDDPTVDAVGADVEDAGFLAPDGSPGRPGEDFPEGILMSSLFRTAALAWHFQDANLLLASEVGSDSRFVFRRQVRERVAALAPFLLLPDDPYPVVSDGRIHWIQEAFTVSGRFPLSTAHPIDERRTAPYIRNSVKAVVDAVTGRTTLYVAEPDDPIIQAYAGAFPTLLRSLDEMPPGLREHLRYSRHMLNVQTGVLLQYHQESPSVFHGQQERWAHSTQLSVATQAIPYQPEYAFLTLPGEEEESWVLSTVFVPQGRQNLAAFLAARWDPEGGGELLLWDMPVESQLRGPRQVEALIEQDPEISQQFSLWRQGGSEVWTGHLQVVPIGNTILYMEPIFLAADVDAIPEIRRFVVSDGARVVMDTTLDGAIRGLAVGLEGAPLAGAAFPLPGVDLESPAPVREGEAGVLGREALGLLDEAESLLREGDWEGFGRKLRELRSFLERRTGEG
jgi:uncharacterized protein